MNCHFLPLVDHAQVCVSKVPEVKYTFWSRCCKPCFNQHAALPSLPVIKAFSCVPAQCASYPHHLSHNLCVCALHSFSFPSLSMQTDGWDRIHCLISGTTGGSNTGSKGYTQAWLRGMRNRVWELDWNMISYPLQVLATLLLMCTRASSLLMRPALLL